MPIEAKIAKQLVNEHWMGLRSIPEQRVVVQLAIDALARHARSEGHAKRVCESIRDTCQFWPSVAEVTQACEYTPDDVLLARTRSGCQWCNGDAYISTDGPYGLSYALPCGHDGRHSDRDRGMTLTASQAERYRSGYNAAEVRRVERDGRA